MTPVDRDDNAQDDPRRFEQWLLDSARADELPRDVSGAWARFGARLATVGELAARATHAEGVAASSGSARMPARAIGATRIARSARLVSLKWLCLAVLAGSALTALGVSRAREWRKSASALAPSTAAVARVAPSAVATASPPLNMVPLAASSAARELVARPSRVAVPHRHEALSSRSTLGAQVALLDAARADLAAGSFAEALRATDRYQREFPTGELSPDAEVVAMEALAARGDHDALRERAGRFLARYPADPHAVRVKALVER